MIVCASHVAGLTREPGSFREGDLLRESQTMGGASHSSPASEQEKAFSPAHDTDLAAASRLGLIGGVVLVACLTVYVLGGVAGSQSKSGAYLAYLFWGGVAPLLAASLLLVVGHHQRLQAKLELAPRLFLAFVLIGMLVLGGLEYASRSLLSARWPFFAVVFGSALVTAILCLPRRRPHRLPRLSDPVRRSVVLRRLDVLLIGLLVAFTVFFGRFYPAGHAGVPLASDLVIYAWETPHFAAWLVFGFVFTCAALGLWRFESGASIRHRRLFDRLALLGATLFVLGLFDDGQYIDLWHYLPYVGPAMHALHGGRAMVDVYSQYGLLPWVVIKVAFGLFEPTFGTAALVVTMSRVATVLAMILVLYAISRRRVAALSLMVPAVLVAITFHPYLYNLNALPSTSGMRYLVPALMVLVLTAVPLPVWSRWLGIAVLLVASFWSVEAFVYTLAPWGYVLLLQAVRERSLRNAGPTMLIGFTAIGLAHATFVLGTFLATGENIDYRPYFGQFLSYRPDAEPTGWWQQPFDPNFGVWVPVFLGHFLVLSAAAYRALRGGAPTDMASRLVPVAAYGFATLNYFMGTPAWPSLGIVFLPVAIEMICVMEVLSTRLQKYGTVGAAGLLALVAVSSMMVAFGTERYARPMAPYLGNSSVLRHCFTAEGCKPAEIVRRVQRSLAAAPLDPDGPISIYFSLKEPEFVQNSENLPRIAEAVELLQRWAPNQRRVALLVDSDLYVVGLVVLMQTGQWYRWPIQAPMTDRLSEPLVELILRHVAQDPMRNGEILVVSNDRDRLTILERKILEVVSAHCRLALVETRRFHSAFRIESCDSVPASQLRLPGGNSR